MLRTEFILIAGLLATLPAHADPAKISSVATFNGECQRFEVTETEGVTSAACANVMEDMTFADGYTSIQFRSLDVNGKDFGKVAFVGPRWTQVDETHSSMVIEQVVLARLPNGPVNATAQSGFCLFTLKSKEEAHDNPQMIYCEYNMGKASHIYMLTKAIKAKFQAVK